MASALVAVTAVVADAGAGAGFARRSGGNLLDPPGVVGITGSLGWADAADWAEWAEGNAGCEGVGCWLWPCDCGCDCGCNCGCDCD